MIAEGMVIHKLGLGKRHLPLLRNVLKTALISLFAGVVTYIVYANFNVFLHDVGAQFAQAVFTTSKIMVLNFAGGSLVLVVCGLVFAPIYLFLANFTGVIEAEEKESVKNLFRKVFPKFFRTPLADPQG